MVSHIYIHTNQSITTDGHQSIHSAHTHAPAAEQAIYTQIKR